ncbi:MAG: hypothetical protein WAL56_00430 [Candidatus Sulfotelmatobacter sp.]
MKRLILKLCTVVLLSVTHGAALSGNFIASAATNPVKDASKTNFVCICEPSGYEVICHTSCTICCGY